MHALRIAAGVPLRSESTPMHKSLPHELGLIGPAVHLAKGCYRGQETVARLHNMGRPPGGWSCCTSTGPSRTPAQRSCAGERTVGRVGSVAQHHELGPIGLGGDQALHAGGCGAVRGRHRRLAGSCRDGSVGDCAPMPRSTDFTKTLDCHRAAVAFRVLPFPTCGTSWSTGTGIRTPRSRARKRSRRCTHLHTRSRPRASGNSGATTRCPTGGLWWSEDMAAFTSRWDKARTSGGGTTRLPSWPGRTTRSSLTTVW
jgi:folate-binding protein YgfZ